MYCLLAHSSLPNFHFPSLPPFLLLLLLAIHMRMPLNNGKKILARHKRLEITFGQVGGISSHLSLSNPRFPTNVKHIEPNIMIGDTIVSSRTSCSVRWQNSSPTSGHAKCGDSHQAWAMFCGKISMRHTLVGLL